MKKVWILFSYASGWDESKHFHNIFWEKPKLEDLRQYFNEKVQFTSHVLDHKYTMLLKGIKVALYGETYRIEEFTEPKTRANETITSIFAAASEATNMLSAAEGV